MKHLSVSIIAVVTLIFGVSSCRREAPRELGVFRTSTISQTLDLDAIQQGGELIVATLYGSESYFEYYGEHFGTQYRLAEAYAHGIGCTIRVDVMYDEVSLLKYLHEGNADMAAYAMSVNDSLAQGFFLCGTAELTQFIDSTRPVAWLVRKDAPQLAQSVNGWMSANAGQFKQLTAVRVADADGRVYAPRRRNYTPILDAARGQISHYDHLLRKYSTLCGWDWRLLAAQAYQESSFDPLAVSPMGALGLMQLMPSTARSVGVSVSQAFEPETNLRGAVRYIKELQTHYASIPNPAERTKFVLAAYNAGPAHIDDARRLAGKYGSDPDRWTGAVDYYVLHLSESRYYNDPVVTHGYMRGSETYNYVLGIMRRWSQYRATGQP